MRSGIYSTRDARIAHDRHDRDDRYINSKYFFIDFSNIIIDYLSQNDYSVHRSFNRHHPVDVDSSTTTLQRHHGVHDRASYRNFAYERDMGRVAPLSGFDEVETTLVLVYLKYIHEKCCFRERRLCLSDDECDIVEKDIKRTHTTRLVKICRIKKYRKMKIKKQTK